MSKSNKKKLKIAKQQRNMKANKVWDLIEKQYDIPDGSFKRRKVYTT